MSSSIDYLSATKRKILWKFHRRLQYRLKHFRPFDNYTNKKKLLIISEPHKVSQSQIFPFYFYYKEIAAEYNLQIREILNCHYQMNSDRYKFDADIVCVQTWFDVSEKKLRDLFSLILKKNKNAKIVYLDSFSPLDLRLASVLNDYIDIYIKKHIFKDRSQYGKYTQGDTNLTDYYGKLFNIKQPNIVFKIPDTFLDKLLVGPGFVTDSNILPYLFGRPSAPNGLKTIDIHNRITTAGSEWYQKMRELSVDVIKNMKEYNSLTSSGIKYRKFIRELRSSKICLSPFGYGEVCWRDYEAVCCGSLLMKPDMSHVDSYPDIFLPYKTYIPIKWDFSDIGEKVSYYTKNMDEAGKVIKNAYNTLHEYATCGGFMKQLSCVFG